MLYVSRKIRQYRCAAYMITLENREKAGRKLDLQIWRNMFCVSWYNSRSMLVPPTYFSLCDKIVTQMFMGFYVLRRMLNDLNILLLNKILEKGLKKYIFTWNVENVVSWTSLCFSDFLLNSWWSESTCLMTAQKQWWWMRGRQWDKY